MTWVARVSRLLCSSQTTKPYVIYVTIREETGAASKYGPHAFPFVLGDCCQWVSIPILLRATVHLSGGSLVLFLSAEHLE